MKNNQNSREKSSNHDKNHQSSREKLKTEEKNLKTQGKNSIFRHIHMLAMRKRWPKNKPELLRLPPSIADFQCKIATTNKGWMNP